MGMGKRRSKPMKKTGSTLAGQQDDLDLNLMKLTGVGYEEYSGRHIPCITPECDFRFSRRYDLQVHLQARHGLSAHQANLLATSTVANLQHWNSGLEASPDNAIDDADPMTPLMNQQPSDQGNLYEEVLSQGGQFWIGGDLGEADADDEWNRDQKEVQRLIDGGDSGVQRWPEIAATIDPMLQQ